MSTAPDGLGKLEKVWHLNGQPNLGLHIAILGRLIDRVATQRLSEFGLNPARWRAIALLSLAEESSFGELADYAWFDRGDLSRALKRLEDDGFVSRRPHPDDRRSVLFALTPRGREIYSGFSADWRGLEREFEGLFGADDLSALNEAMARIAALCLKLEARD